MDLESISIAEKTVEKIETIAIDLINKCTRRMYDILGGKHINAKKGLLYLSLPHTVSERNRIKTTCK